MKTILGLETSCDETAAAVVVGGRRILSNVVASSQALHQKTGGIIPEVAAREQIKCLLPVVQEALTMAKLKPSQLDALAVTVGPGLIGSLLVGVASAKTLAYLWQKPVVAVNHLKAHLYANWLTGRQPVWPAIGLVVSGGHTDLVFLKSHTVWQWLGGTRDDAAGECFDKTARVLGLGYPGGPAIAAAAAKSKKQKNKFKIKLPRPMIRQNNFDFSFSGLKTAVINLVKSEQAAHEQINQPALAAAIQAAIGDVLVTKTANAVAKYQAKGLLLGGGVAANQYLRQKLALKIKNCRLFLPEPQLCTDNAANVAARACFAFRPQPWSKIKAQVGLRIA